MRTALIGLITLVMLTLAGVSGATGPWRADESNTRGWQFMTTEERLAHQARIRAFKSYDECRDYQVEHHRAMEARARTHGRTLAPGLRDFCEHLKPTDRRR
jgi:hypothetical protein